MIEALIISLAFIAGINTAKKVVKDAHKKKAQSRYAQAKIKHYVTLQSPFDSTEVETDFSNN